MRCLCLIIATLIATLCQPQTARAEFDWPLQVRLPVHDIAVGVHGGVSFAEDHGRAATTGAAGVDLSYLHGAFGAHLSLTAHPERTGVRLQPLGEVTVWYVGLFGAGISVAPML